MIISYIFLYTDSGLLKNKKAAFNDIFLIFFSALRTILISS